MFCQPIASIRLTRDNMKRFKWDKACPLFPLLFGREKSATSACVTPRNAAQFRNSNRCAVFVVFLLTLTLPLSLSSEESQLSESSPFLPPGYGEEAPKPQKPVVQPQGPISREIEFRGVARIGGVYQFSIYNKKEQKGYWLKENAAEDGISISNYNPNSSTIIVLMNGRSERLTLATATEKPLPVAQTKPGSNARPPSLPPQLQNKSSNQNKKRRTVPRRRVILPKKN